PVFYTLDGSLQFPVAAASYRATRSGFQVPADLIVVGIGCADTMQVCGRRRERDFGIVYSAAEAYPAPGAAAFLRVLREEIFPLIVSAFRTVPADRALAGDSYGGLFAIYTLLHAPETFQRYAIGSPVLDRGPDRGDPAAFRWEADFAAAHKDLAARIYMYLGADADGLENALR